MVVRGVFVRIEAQPLEVDADVREVAEGGELHTFVAHLTLLPFVQRGDDLIGDLLLVGVKDVTEDAEQKCKETCNDEQAVAEDAQCTSQGQMMLRRSYQHERFCA